MLNCRSEWYMLFGISVDAPATTTAHLPTFLFLFCQLIGSTETLVLLLVRSRPWLKKNRSARMRHDAYKETRRAVPGCNGVTLGGFLHKRILVLTNIFESKG